MLKVNKNSWQLFMFISLNFNNSCKMHEFIQEQCLTHSVTFSALKGLVVHPLVLLSLRFESLDRCRAHVQLCMVYASSLFAALCYKQKGQMYFLVYTSLHHVEPKACCSPKRLFLGLLLPLEHHGISFLQIH